MVRFQNRKLKSNLSASRTRQAGRNAVAFGSIGFLVMLCGCARGPSDEVIKTEAEKNLKKRFTNAVTGWRLTEITDLKVNVVDLKIVRKGNYNKEDNYWPVEISASGKVSYTERIFYEVKNREHTFPDKKYQLEFFKDDYGQWQCR